MNKVEKEDDGSVIDGMQTAKILQSENLTPGEYSYSLICRGTNDKFLPDFYKSDVEKEFEHIWTFQKQFYPDILTDKLKESLKDKNEKQTWAICQIPFGISGMKRNTKGKELVKENYEWRSRAIKEKLDLEQLAVVLQKVNAQLKRTDSYLGRISDRSKELYFTNQTIGQYQYKLVQENFDQLNKSVEQLNLWQQENKTMISALIMQYKQMCDDLEMTSTAIANITANTKLLVGDDGKLQELITALKTVMIDDKHFIEITSNLSSTASLTKTNMKQFEESTKALNNWVRKQRNFVDSVVVLIEKLEDLNKIRDYNDNFWKSTKHSLEEGIGYITQGTKSLNQQLTNLDRQFYSRLSATLAELDNCIQAMIKSKK